MEALGGGGAYTVGGGSNKAVTAGPIAGSVNAGGVGNERGAAGEGKGSKKGSGDKGGKAQGGAAAAAGAGSIASNGTEEQHAVSVFLGVLQVGERTYIHTHACTRTHTYIHTHKRTPKCTKIHLLSGV